MGVPESPVTVLADADCEFIASPLPLACATYHSCFCFIAHSDLHSTFLALFFLTLPPSCFLTSKMQNRRVLQIRILSVKLSSSVDASCNLVSIKDQEPIFLRVYFSLLGFECPPGEGLCIIQSISGQDCLFLSC